MYHVYSQDKINKIRQARGVAMQQEDTACNSVYASQFRYPTEIRCISFTRNSRQGLVIYR